MKNTVLNNMPRARLLAVAAAAVAISACGGGGGGGGGGFPILPIAPTPESTATPTPAPAPQPPTPVADNSAPCFNEADFREGTTVEFEAAKLGAGTTSALSSRKSVTESREAFAGAQPIAINVGSKTTQLMQGVQKSTVKKEYRDLVGGNILFYGKSTTEKWTVDPKLLANASAGFNKDWVNFNSQTFEPPLSFPVDMKPGQVATQKLSITTSSAFFGQNQPGISIPAAGELTYHGREKLETPMGTFDTCKISLKITVGASMISKDITHELWLAAEGPYRGQLLKGSDAKSSKFVTTMTYSPK
ncbi:hypothetical protein J2W28_001783 [Variovorax boronicumulans]|uniref:hypothetical protein n=1 Tax=Variovorax boronicumulans TaxID=436515 RepID=UPI00278A9ACB|nr:hypothetical protein [Variovorax boronicumulans]MDP9996038.1 hypothetical protein [Variovorax boronicumulans]MDQ0002643.1 hypothetical protein [Variovorax boronicumulans]